MSNNKFKIAVLLTCFNRKQDTLACLAKFKQACMLVPDHSFKVFLVDDGSTDGTADAVKQAFSEVNIIQGTGSLFWNQGMRLAWNTAVNANKYDFYIWLNDDTMLEENALKELISNYNEVLKKTHKQVVVTGACKESENKNEFSYGGRTEVNNVEPNGEIQYCKYINGNIVLVPKEIYENIGVLSNDYTHGMGDFDYGLRAQRAGYVCCTTKEYIAVCPTNKGVPVWCNPKEPIKKRLQAFYSPRGLNIKEYIIFRKKFWGLKWVFYALKAYVKVIFPKLYSKITK